ncbi:MAG: hypothetical protein J6W80_06590 [Kiritimatiellae bacterium]|nr:hypothetical protein [Kiritimatiellia bacterium]
MHTSEEDALKKDLSLLGDRELVRLLAAEDPEAWEYVLQQLTRQEKASLSRSLKREAWGVSIEDLLGELYEDMIGKEKLRNYDGKGSLIGWMRSYMRGYLTRKNPNLSRFVDIDGEVAPADSESPSLTLGDKIAKEVSDGTSLYAYGGGDPEVLKRERLDMARKCFTDLWKENSVQAYVMLFKTRFQMSSLEIMDRLGISSAANVDQMFSRAVRKMKELKVKHDK